MPIYTDFSLARYEDGHLVLIMEPPQPLGGQNIECRVAKRFGSQSGIIRSVDSGFNGASGITITDSGAGQLRVQLRNADGSGLDPGNYAWGISRLNSGSATALANGYLMIKPSMLRGV